MENRARIISLIVFSSIAILMMKLPFSAAQEISIPANAIVQIQVIKNSKRSERVFGTGFFIKNDQVITNRHVVKKIFENPYDYQIYGCVQNTTRTKCTTLHYQFEIIPTEGTGDLALLKIIKAKHLGEWKDLSLLPKKRHSYFSKGASVVRGEKVSTAGYRTDFTGKISHSTGSVTGYFSEGDDDFFITNNSVNYGDSGSPVVNEKGELAGVIVACLAEDEKTCKAFGGIFIPSYQVERWYVSSVGSEFLARE